MSAIGKGDWLECVRHDRCSCGCAGVTPPNVYRCAALAPPPAPWCGFACLLCGAKSTTAIVVEGQEDHYYCACCFKPGGYRPSEEVRRPLDTPVTVSEDA